jgi:hypothetical protein
MYVDSDFALTPAAIISDAKVWRPSWRVIGSSSAFLHARAARFRRGVGAKGCDPFPNTRPSTSAALMRCSTR